VGTGATTPGGEVPAVAAVARSPSGWLSGMVAAAGELLRERGIDVR